MPTNEDVELLRSELADYVRRDDHEGVRRIYRELVAAGQTRHEVMDEVIHLATAQSVTPQAGGTDQHAAAEPIHASLERIRTRHLVFGSAPKSDTHDSAFGDSVEADFGAAPDISPDGLDQAVLRPRRAIHAIFFTIPLLGFICLFYAHQIGEDGSATQLLVSGNARSTAPAEAEIPVPNKESAEAPERGSGLTEVAVALVARREETSSDSGKATPLDANPAPGAQVLPKIAVIPSVAAATVDAATPPSSSVPAVTASILPNSLLIERGDILFGRGDLFSARLYYQRAAEAGDAQAALRLGETHDPAFLGRIRFNGPPGNAAMATYWYKRAQELGAPEAAILLEAMPNEQAHSEK